MAALLEVRDLDVRYGEIQALRGVSLEVRGPGIVAIIGANGSGKSTLLRAISGVIGPRAGDIRFAGRSLRRLASHRIARAGVVHVPEGRSILARMSVFENLELGAFARRDRRHLAADLDRVYALFPRLAERRRQLGGSLSGGEQQMLAIGRALMARPRLLMLDEPSLGLAPMLVAEIFDVIPRLAADGLAVLLVEQNARMALACASDAYVLQSGSIVLSGTAAQLARQPAVQHAYLGALVQTPPAG